MGIPFYFMSLIKAHKGIVQTVKHPLQVDVLGVDFNCLIHRYLQDHRPVESVVEALAHILEHTCKAKKVIIALDGLVPYAKIVQQRYRRMAIKTETSVFDRNQISPDTPYMRELESALKAKFPFAIFSGTLDAGEGEHKIISELKHLPENQRRSICVYGLDADLILICLQNHKLSFPHSMYLLRESDQFNDKSNMATFSTLSIWTLLNQLPLELSQYMALSILCFGNDFMPNLAMFSLREDGYDRALHYYKESGNPDLTTSAGRRQFLEYAGTHELEVLSERIGLRKRPEEKALWGKSQDLISKKYGLHVLDGVCDMKPVVEAFWKTFHWTNSYFHNNLTTHWSWTYPYADAPLIQDILKFKETTLDEQVYLNYTISDQLSFILPHSSVRKAKRRVKYEDEMYSETRNIWMKRHDWEMKPYVSLPWNPIYHLTSVSPL